MENLKIRRSLPPIAVVMTAYNAESTITRAVNSVLAQNYDGDLRLILVEDGSTDRTESIARQLNDPRIELYSGKRRGRVRSLNFALDAAQGSELVANLDADDIMLPGRLAFQSQSFMDDAKLGVLGGGYYEVHRDPTGRTIAAFRVSPPGDRDEMREQMARGFPICHSTATYRRDTAVELGGFNPLLRARIDFDLWLRFASDGFSVVNAPALFAIHFKNSGTFFDKEYSRFRSARQMARLNYLAAGKLDLGVKGYSFATARLAYSLTRRQSVKRLPRFALPISSESDEYLSIATRLGRDEQ